MDAFEVEAEIAADPARILAALWDVARWPSLAPHVCGVELHYADEHVQVLSMEVNSRGQLHRFKSVRIREPGTIVYWQPDPPPLLRRHRGSWRVEPLAHGIRVVSRHEVEIDEEAAAAFLRATGRAQETRENGAGMAGEIVAERVRELISGNSLQTMLALKRRLETGEGAADVTFDAQPPAMP